MPANETGVGTFTSHAYNAPTISNFPNATLIDEQPLLADSLADRQNPKFSPDGKEVAFIEDECRLMVVNVATKAVRQVTDGSEWFMGGFNYAWSPDGKWFSLEIIGNGHDPYSDVAIVKADGSEKPVNLTGSGYFSSQPRWVLDGNAVLFLTDRYGMRSHASWFAQRRDACVYEQGCLRQIPA